jgi:putative ABC transport system permease protein
VKLGRYFDSWFQDVVLSCRGLRQRFGFTLVAIVSLALGIGANALVFSVVNSVLLQPLDYPDADRLVAVWLTPPNEPDQRFGTNTGVFFTVRDNNTSFESFGTGRLNETATITVAGDDRAHWMPSQWFSPGLIETLGVEPLIGDWPPRDPEGVAISYDLWQSVFGGSPNALGTLIDFGIVTAEIQAVMPQGFHVFNPDTDVWIYQPDEGLTNALRSPNRLFTLIGRLKPGVTIAQAQAEMDSLAQVISSDFPETHMGWGLRVESLHHAYVGGFRELLWVFQGAVFFVLLIACANIGALVLSKAAARQKELAVRSALGSGRWRVIRQLLTDNLVLSALGAGLGIILARVGVASLVAAEIEGFPRLSEVSMDWRVVAFASLIALGTGVVFGLLPGLHASRPNLMNVLRDATRGTSEGVSRQRFRAAFVVGQVSLALVILVASSLLLRSFALINAAGVGFNPNGLTVLELPFPRSYLRTTGENTAAGGLLVERDGRFGTDSEAVIERLESLPGVRSVAAAATAPLGGLPPRVGLLVDGEELLPSEQTARTAEWYPVSSGYFDTLEIPVLRGRTFSAGDGPETLPVAIINAAVAERFWPGEDPIGKLVRTDVIDAPTRTVVGVVGNVRQDRYQRVPQPQIYIPRLQVPARMDNAVALQLLLTDVVVRTDSGLAAMDATLRNAVQEVIPTLPVSRIRAVEDYASGQIGDLRRATFLLSTFGTIAVALALIGIFGIVTHLVRQRAVELGIRMTLGAQRRSVLWLVLRQAFVLVVIGLAIGTAGAVVLTRLVASFLYGVTTTDPLSFAIALVLLMAVALLACYFPARRVSRIEPMVALRSD